MARTTARHRSSLRFIDDLLDGMGAAAALRDAPKRRIHAAHARPLRGTRDRGPDLRVAEDVA